MQIHEDAATTAAAAAAEKAAEEAFVAGKGSPSGGSPGASSGSKAPRAEAPRPSPNQRLRKARRAEELQHPAAHKVTTRHHTHAPDAPHTGAQLHNTTNWKCWIPSLQAIVRCESYARPHSDPTRIHTKASMKCSVNSSSRGYPGYNRIPCLVTMCDAADLIWCVPAEWRK